MSPIKKIMLALIVIPALSGCKPKITYTNLLEHPDLLKQEVMRCQSATEKTADKIEECKMIMTAAAEFMSILNEAQSNPEQFGQKTLEAEIACSKAKKTMQLAKEKLITLKNQQAPAQEIKSAEDAFHEAEKTYRNEHQQIKVFFAVLGLGTPE